MSEKLENNSPPLSKSHNFFIAIDKPYAKFLSKLGLKYFSQQVDFPHPDFFTNVYRRWILGWVISFAIGFIAFQVTMQGVLHDMPLNWLPYIGIFHALLGFFSLMAFQIFLLAGRFNKGKELRRGRTAIDKIHIAGILFLPTIWSLFLLGYWVLLKFSYMRIMEDHGGAKISTIFSHLL